MNAKAVQQLLVTKLFDGPSVVLGDPDGLGKTVSLCTFVAGVMNGKKLRVERLDVAKETMGGVEKVTAMETVTRSAAQVIDKVLDKFGDNIDVERCPEDWTETKRAWLNLCPGRMVPYSDQSVHAYACGTTLMHAVMMHVVFGKFFHGLDLKGKSVMFLCGGSCAELVALKTFLGSAFHEVENIFIVDVNSSWSSVTSAFARAVNDQAKPKISFHKLDLLDSGQWETLKGLVQQCALMTLVYGLTEVYDMDRHKTENCIEHILQNMKLQAKFVVIDPLKSCHGKIDWLEDLCRAQNEFTTNLVETKIMMDPEHVLRSPLHTWIARMKLEMNEDVKLTTKVWIWSCERVESRKKAKMMHKSKDPNLVLFVTHQDQDVKYCEQWIASVASLNAEKRVRVFSLNGLSKAQSEQEIRSALWHLESALTLYGGNVSGVAIINFVQMEIVQSHSRALMQMFRQAKVGIVDNLHLFLNHSNLKKSMRLLESMLPPKDRRILVCSQAKHHASALSMIGNDDDKVFTVVPDSCSLSERLKTFCNCELISCKKFKTGTCTVPNHDSKETITVSFDRKSALEEESMPYKTLQFLPGTLDANISHIVFSLPNKNIPSEKLDAFAEMAVSKITHPFANKTRVHIHFH